MQTVKFEDKDFFIEISRTKDDKVYISLTETLDSVDKRHEDNPETYDLVETGD
jgi:hypothetical protein